MFNSLARAVANLQRHDALTDLGADALRSRADFRQRPSRRALAFAHRGDASRDLGSDRQQARLMTFLKALLRFT